MEVELGSKIKDEMTGLRGIATARCEYLNGCVQFEITPTQLKDGEPQKVHWLDVQRVVFIKATPKAPGPPGGPGNHPDIENPSS